MKSLSLSVPQSLSSPDHASVSASPSANLLATLSTPFEDAIRQYLLFIKHERGLARETCMNSSSWLTTYRKWLLENGYPVPAVSDAFSEQVLRRYLYHQSQRGLRPRTIRAAFYPIRAMGDRLTDEGLFEANPARSIRLPKKDAAVRIVTSDQEILQLLEACGRISPLRRSAMARAVLSTLAFSGLRRQELLDLQVGDVDLEDGSVLVRSGKGSKSRRIFPCAECLSALKEWLALRGRTSHAWLWAYDSRRRIHDDGLKTLLDEIKAAAGLREAGHILPHSLRHAAATRLLRNGANLRDIQAYLGHSNVQTTAIYLHSDEESQRQMAQLGSIRRAASGNGAGEVSRRRSAADRPLPSRRWQVERTSRR